MIFVSDDPDRDFDAWDAYMTSLRYEADDEVDFDEDALFEDERLYRKEGNHA